MYAASIKSKKHKKRVRKDRSSLNEHGLSTWRRSAYLIDKAATEKAPIGSKRPLNLHIPLHSPRVEIILAWLAAVHLVELESIA